MSYCQNCADLQERIETLTAERDGWQETAAQNQRNTDFYRDLVVAVGRLLGPEVYRADDGSVSQDVLCLKVPEVASRLTADHAALRTVVREWQEASAQFVKDASTHGHPDMEIFKRCSAASDALRTFALGGGNG